jgi:hypothetical protein
LPMRLALEEWDLEAGEEQEEEWQQQQQQQQQV